MKNLIIGAFILGAVGYGGSKLLLHHKIESGVDQAVMAMSPFVNIDYKGVSSTLDGELTVDAIEAKMNDFNDTITIDRMGIDTPNYFALLSLADIGENMGNPNEVIPDHFGFIAEGIRVRVDADYFRKLHKQLQDLAVAVDAGKPAAVCTGKYGYSPETLAELGYAEQVISVSAHFRREPDNYFVTIKSSIEDMWEMDAELTLAGNMVAELSRGPRARPKLSAMRIEYIDHSLNERVTDYCARLGLSNDEIIAAQLDKLAHYGKELGIEFDEYVIEPYTEFVSGKSRLIFTAKPTEPIAISQISLYKPSDVPALLDLSAEAL